MKTFEEAWKATGYRYGEDELEGVKLGWELCTKELNENDFKAAAEQASEQHGSQFLLFVRPCAENSFEAGAEWARKRLMGLLK